MASSFHALIKSAFSSWLSLWNENHKSHIWRISLLNFPSWFFYYYSSTYHHGVVSLNDCWLSRKKCQNKSMLVIVVKTANKPITKLLIWGSRGTHYLTYPLDGQVCIEFGVVGSLFIYKPPWNSAQNKGIQISVQEFLGVVDHFWIKIDKKKADITKFNTNLTVQGVHSA